MAVGFGSGKRSRGIKSAIAVTGAGALVVLGVAVGAAPVKPQAKATTPITHVIVIMEENHTFDNYFGAFPGVNSNPVGPSGQPWGVTEPRASDPLPYDLNHSGPRA